MNGEDRSGLKSAYAFNDLQSARIEQHRFALRALSQIAQSEDLPLEETTVINRAYLAALFEVLEEHLGGIIGPSRVSHVWLRPDQVPDPEPDP